MDDKGRIILLVDDDINSVEITKYLFEQEGYICLTAINHAQALEIVKGAKVDAAVIDLRMPGVDGNQLIKDLRAEYSFPIVAFTALDSFEVHEEALSSGANCVITKPCAPRLLLETVEKLIEEAQGKVSV